MPATLPTDRRTAVLGADRKEGMGKFEVVLTVSLDGGGSRLPLGFSLRSA
jgi:hypothetical protein